MKKKTVDDILIAGTEDTEELMEMYKMKFYNRFGKNMLGGDFDYMMEMVEHAMADARNFN